MTTSIPPQPPQEPGESSPNAPEGIQPAEENQHPASQPQGQDEPDTSPGTGAQETTAPQKPSLFRRFGRWLLGADSPVGRVVRRVLRALLLALLCAFAGILFFFFQFHRPVTAELEAAKQTLSERERTVTNQQMQLASRQAELSSAQEQIKTLGTDLRSAQNRGGLLVLMNDVAAARMELALKDGARTLENIEKARKDLDTIFSFINEKDPKAAAEIKSRLDLMANVLARDPQLAKSDLDNLFTALLAIHDQLFKK